MNKDLETRGSSKQTSVQSSKNGHGRPAPIQGASIDDLSQRLSAIDGVNEDMAVFLAHNWKRFLGGLGVTLLVVVLFYQYKGTQQTRLGEAAQRFDEASRGLAAISAPASPDPAADEKARGAFFEQVKLLENSNRDTLYGKVAGLYAVEAHIARGELPAAEAALAKYDADSFSRITTAKKSVDVTGSNVQSELAALLKARLLIARGDQDLTPARKLLTGLALGGRYMNLEALLVLFRIASTPEALAEAQKTTSSLITERPELREIITTQLSSAGFAVGAEQ